MCSWFIEPKMKIYTERNKKHVKITQNFQLTILLFFLIFFFCNKTIDINKWSIVFSRYFVAFLSFGIDINDLFKL